jgi:hypothetical protein
VKELPMQKSNQRLDTFIGEIMSGEPSPIATSAEAIEERVWSGEIAEIDQQTFGFYMKDNAGPPKLMIDDWYVFSDARLVTQPGILFWKQGARFYARRLDQEQWDKLLKAAKVTKKFW